MLSGSCECFLLSLAVWPRCTMISGLIGASPFFPSIPVPSSPPFPSPFLLPLEVGPLIAAAKRFLVHFKHYYNRKWIENQISNSKIGVWIYNNIYRRKVIRNRANLRRKKTKFLAKKIPCTDDCGAWAYATEYDAVFYTLYCIWANIWWW